MKIYWKATLLGLVGLVYLLAIIPFGNCSGIYNILIWMTSGFVFLVLFLVFLIISLVRYRRKGKWPLLRLLGILIFVMVGHFMVHLYRGGAFDPPVWKKFYSGVDRVSYHDFGIVLNQDNSFILEWGSQFYSCRRKGTYTKNGNQIEFDRGSLVGWLDRISLSYRYEGAGLIPVEMPDSISNNFVTFEEVEDLHSEYFEFF